MRVVNQAIDNTLAERKDRLKIASTWQKIIERGIQACEDDNENGGSLVPITFRKSPIVSQNLLGKIYYVAKELASWIAWILDREDNVESKCPECGGTVESGVCQSTQCKERLL